MHMKIRHQLLLILTAGMLAGPMAALAQANYDYESIVYPGSEFDQVFGINDRGDAVGNGFVDPDTIPYVYDTKKGTFTNVVTVPGFDVTSVLGISDKGVLVGSVFDADLGTESGVIIDKKGNATVFSHPDAVFFTQARAVNNKGQVTGYRDSPNDLFLLENGFIYDSKTGTFTDIVPSIFTIAQGINSQGDVVGSAIFDEASGVDDPCGSSDPFVRRGWRRAKDGTVTYFSVNGGETSARGITDSGIITGFVNDPDSGMFKGLVVELDGSQCQSFTIADADLLQFPGGFNTFAQGIKNSGEIVGSYDDGMTISGFVARPK